MIASNERVLIFALHSAFLPAADRQLASWRRRRECNLSLDVDARPWNPDQGLRLPRVHF